jgi:hypothetical protein
MIAQSLLTGEEASAFLAGKFTDLSMLCDLMSQPVVLSREFFRTTQSTGEGYTWFWLVRFHVNLEGVLAREASCTAQD